MRISKSSFIRRMALFGRLFFVFVEKSEIDLTAKGLFEAKCALCHELRSPINRSKTSTQWEATVDRMIQEKNAPITPEERNQIVSYLKSLALNSGLTAKLNIAPEATLGRRRVGDTLISSPAVKLSVVSDSQLRE